MADVMDGDQLMDMLRVGPKDKTPALPPPPSEDGNALMDSLRNPPSQAELLAREKQHLQGAEEKPGAFLARTMLPWGATAINVSRDVKYKSAKERYDKGEARYDDLEQIASYEHLRDLRSKYNTGGKLLEGAARIPGMVAETVAGGAMLEPLTALQAAPAISATGGVSGRALAQQAGLGLIKNAATTAATPSMYLGQASERSVANGGSLFAPQNIGPAYVEGMITNAILGKAKAGGIGLPTIAGRTVTGMAEQQGADLITSAVDELHDSKAWKFNTGYGLAGEIARDLRGKEAHPLQHLATQAFTFAVFSAMHGGDHKSAEVFGEAAKSLHEAGYSEADAAKVLASAGTPPPLPGPVAAKVADYAQTLAEATTPPKGETSNDQRNIPVQPAAESGIEGPIRGNVPPDAATVPTGIASGQPGSPQGVGKPTWEYTDPDGPIKFNLAGVVEKATPYEAFTDSATPAERARGEGKVRSTILHLRTSNGRLEEIIARHGLGQDIVGATVEIGAGTDIAQRLIANTLRRAANTPPTPPVAPGPAEVSPAGQPAPPGGGITPAEKIALAAKLGFKGKDAVKQLEAMDPAVLAAFERGLVSARPKAQVIQPEGGMPNFMAPETKPPETPPVERRQPDGVSDVTLSPPKSGVHISGEKINTHKLLDAAGKEIGEVKIIPRGENLHVEWIGMRGAATGEAAATGKIGRAGVKSLLGQIAEQYPDAAAVSGLRGERRAKISIPREDAASAAPVPPEAPPRPPEKQWSLSKENLDAAVEFENRRLKGIGQKPMGDAREAKFRDEFTTKAFLKAKGGAVVPDYKDNPVPEDMQKEIDAAKLDERSKFILQELACGASHRDIETDPEFIQLQRRLGKKPIGYGRIQQLDAEAMAEIGNGHKSVAEWAKKVGGGAEPGEAEGATATTQPVEPVDHADPAELLKAIELIRKEPLVRQEGESDKAFDLRRQERDFNLSQAEIAFNEAEQHRKDIHDVAADLSESQPDRASSLRSEAGRALQRASAGAEVHAAGQGTPPGPNAPPAGPAQATGGSASAAVAAPAVPGGRPARRDIVAEGWHAPLMTPQQAAQRERMRQINADKGQSLLSVVRKLGIDKVSATEAGWNTDLIEEDFPRLFKRGGKNLAELAEHLGNEGHTEPIPEEHQTNPGDWLLEKLRNGVQSLHSDLENRYAKESARAAQDAREAASLGFTPEAIAQARAAGEAAGEAEGCGLDVEEITRELRNEGDAAEPAGGSADFEFGANDPVIDADWKYKLPGGGQPGQPDVAPRPGPESANPYAPNAARDTRPQKLTALANAKVDAERRANGLPEIMKPARQANPESWDKAMDRLEADPQAGAKLVDELAKKTRATTVEENALLLHEKITRSNDLSRKTRTYLDAMADVIDGKPGAASAGDLEILDAQVEAARERVSQVDHVTKSTGTEWGRAGQFRRQLAAEDYSLGGMIETARAAKGKKLTPEEEIEIGKMQQRIIDLEGKLADAEGRLEAEGKGADSKAFDAWNKTRAASEDAKGDFRRKVGQFRDQARPITRKLEDLLTRWRRFGVLSGVKTLGKIGTAGLEQIAFNPIYEAVGSGLRQIPGLDKIAALAPREGAGFRGKIEAKAFMSAFTEGMMDSWQTLRKGRSELDVLYGHGEGEYENKGWLDWPGIVHAAIKAPARRGEYTRSLLHRLDAEAKAGRDPTTPASLMRAGYEAYKDSNRSVFREDNRVAEAVQKFIAPNATDGAGMRGVRLTGRLLLPVTKVPTNLVAQAVESTVGMVTGSVRAGLAMRRGVETLKPQQADLIMRQLKRGSIGAALFALGALAPNVAGGFWKPGKKKDELEPMEVATPAGNVPGTFLHHPAFYALQAGSSFRRTLDSSMKKHKTEVATENAVGDVISGLVEETPFGRETLEIGRDMEAKEKGYKFGEFVKSASVPQLFQWLAGETDKPHPFSQSEKPTPRKPEGVGEHIQTGIPWARERVPVGKRR